MQSKLRWGCLLILITNSVHSELVQIMESELSSTYAQGLLDISKYDFNGNNFYKVGTNASIETSINIDSMNLGDQIVVENFALTGANPDGTYNDDSVSSAVITNPFIEFAFKDSIALDNGANRDFIGVRFGAENIDAWMSFGHYDNYATASENGISKFRGFLQTTAVTGAATTAAEVRTTPIDTTFRSFWAFCVPIDITGHAEVNVPEISINYNIASGVTLDSSQTGTASGGNADANGVITTAYMTAWGDPVTVPYMSGKAYPNEIPLEPDMNIYDMRVSGSLTGDNNDPIKMLIREDLKYLHQSRTQNSGMFISFQKEDMDWYNPGTGIVRTTSNTTAGWWMEFMNPIDIGTVNISGYTLPQQTIDDIGDAVNQQIAARPCSADLFTINVNDPEAHLPLRVDPLGSGITASVHDSNIVLDRQPIRNCWGQSWC